MRLSDAFAVLLLLQTGAPLRQLPASIEGTVIRAGTKTPISGVMLELTGIASRTVEGSSTTGRGVISVNVRETEGDGSVLSYTATTGRKGEFEFRNIRPGQDYQLVAMSPPEYVPSQFGQRVPSVPGRSISLAAGEALKDITIEMTPSASISGVVVDSAGGGMRNVTVELRRPWYLEGWRLLLEWNELISRVQGVGKTNRAGAARTNARGEFSFEGLAPAQYYVRIDSRSGEVATLVNLHAGSSISDVKLVAPEIAPRLLKGMVVNEAGVPLQLAQVSLFPRGLVPLYQRGRIAEQTVENGALQLIVPGPGKYVLIAAAHGGSADLFGRKEIEVKDAEPADILRIVVTPGFALSGEVRFEGRLAGNASAEPLTLYFYPGSVGVPALKATPLPRTNGRFSVGGLMPGDYRVEVLPILTVPPSSLVPSALEDVYVKSIMLDGKDVLNGGLHLEKETRSSLQIVISSNGGTVEGRVADSSGKPTSNVKVVMVPNAPRRQRGDLYKYVSTDDSGDFQIRGLASGEYKLFAFERVEEGAWQDPEFMSLVENRGTALRVGEGSRVTVNVRLIPAWN